MRPEEINIPKEKFVLVNENKKLRDKELVTKPVGFFMDAMHRFAKNKGSIVGAIVIGFLFLYALIAPIFSPYTVEYKDTYYRYVLPKVFNSEHFDFLDGCSTKTVNETTFLYYYSMGVETGHNAIKRQDYKYEVRKNDVQDEYRMYTYREDSYQKVGTVFITGVTPSQYENIQEYQDAHNVQIIYPITDLDKRPEATQNTKDANYWFETKTEGSISVPDNYTINDDGTVTFTPIYSQYETGALLSTAENKNAIKVKLVSKDDGFAVSFTKEYVEKDEDDNDVVRTYVEYLKCYVFNDSDVAVATDELEEASVFKYDSVHNVLTTYIDGHDDVSLDGNYFFSLKADTGSNAFLLNENSFSSADFNKKYSPFLLYEKLNTPATSAEADKEYYLGAARKTTESKYFYYSGYSTIGNFSFNTAEASKNAENIYLVDDGGGNYLLNVGTNKIAKYLNVTANGNNNSYAVVNDAADAISWVASSYTVPGSDPAITYNTLKTTVTGHTDASLDGDYIFCLKYDDSKNYSITLALESDVSSANHLYPLSILSNTTTTASTISAGQYYFGLKQSTESTLTYYANGNFGGDAYTSKMRIEGQDVYKYAYARPTNGTYEIRVNYYEYYIYYHQSVLKDRINQPFFLFGTTANGQDIFTCLASGARFSFALAIIVASVNLFVGAIFGAIEGYYGGKIDLIMERIVEILSAVPFMIVITLLKYHMGGTSHAVILFISFFLTGWIGMSGTVRMQFYRFKNQEYVLASRTLGAKDLRIMFKHIFPNALGTIVTSTVLVIPGMIFSETSLSYLGIINLNSGSLTSVGTLLANAQPYLVSYPHMILFPAIFISLLMLCFNLFGNGLRDAFNPSLRGTED